jgi:tRNA(Arg) A34 adenosine deaminase TadA
MNTDLIAFRHPAWLKGFLARAPRRYSRRADRMKLVLELSRLNVERGTGGPFGAAIFERRGGRLIAVGVNMVVSAASSVAHAEIMAIMAAQREAGTHDLGGAGLPALELVTSTEPCAMCQGAVAWSGLRSLVCGARGRDAERVGFDEGVKAADWVRQFRRRGIAVARDVCRREAMAVLQRYRDMGGQIYNGRGSQIGLVSSRRIR